MGRERRWWGWGDQEHEAPLSRAAEAMLREYLGDTEAWPRPDGFEAIELPPAAAIPTAVLDAAGREALAADPESRIRHAVGKGYADLARLRQGRLERAPDAVICPAEAAALPALLEACAASGVAVVPFGGGTSVVGGVEAVKGGHRAVISLDLSRLRRVEVDRVSRLARLGAGLRGPEAEAALNEQGFTLGHFPQSFEQATIGGFAATRSAGQASTGYGRFDELVSSVSMIAPAGSLETLASPHTAAGPSLRQVILGSEGCLGIIPEVTVRLRPAPAVRRYEAWFAESFAAGTELLRGLAQEGIAPDVIRLSDEFETRVTLAVADLEGPRRSLFETYLRLRRVSGGCLIVAGWEGGGEDVRRRRAIAAEALRSGGGVYLGTGPGKAWLAGRYEGPYLRDTLMNHGVMVETLETSHVWGRLGELYERVSGALSRAMEAQGTPGIVNCHISHVYADGASLYFTFLCRARLEDPIAQWQAAKRAASEAIASCGATITHHHAVGRDHRPWMAAEVGETGIEALRALKRQLDPAGIMNPGKLFPEEEM